jgi:YggT family protein
VLLLDAITQVQLFVTVFTSVYSLVLVIYILLTWVRLPPSLGPMQRFLYDVCDPYLRLWRRLLPFLAGPLDFSPMVGIIAVYVAGSLVNLLLDQLR